VDSYIVRIERRAERRRLWVVRGAVEGLVVVVVEGDLGEEGSVEVEEEVGDVVDVDTALELEARRKVCRLRWLRLLRRRRWPRGSRRS
jgi:hypothetical protein